jgi:hypothetical protein
LLDNGSEKNSAATDKQVIIENLLGTMCSVRSVQNGYKRRDIVNWISVGNRAVKRRPYVCCSTVIFGLRKSVRLLQILC